MRLFGKDLDEEPIVIAEIGVNHEGSPGRAWKLITLADKAGADAVKIQVGTVQGGPEREGGKYELSERDIRRLACEAGIAGIPLFASALSLEALELCDELFPVIKIAARDSRNTELTNAAQVTGKPIIVSTACDTDQMIPGAVALHTVSKYPTPIEEARVFRVGVLARKFPHVGYSNHVIGPEACYAAVALGACLIEVHFTDDKTREFRDHELSFDHEDLKDFIPKANCIRKSL